MDVASRTRGGQVWLPTGNEFIKARNAKRPMQSMHRAFRVQAASKELLFEAAHCGGVEAAVYVHDFTADA